MSRYSIMPPVVFECSACGALHHAASALLPVGWSQYPRIGGLWCGSCTALGIPERELPRPGRKPTSKRANAPRHGAGTANISGGVNQISGAASRKASA